MTNNFSMAGFREHVGLVCLVLLLGLAAHGFALPATFKTLDDNYSIIQNKDIKDFANTGKIFTSSFFGSRHYYRPMVSFSFMIEHHWVGLRSFYYNLTNLALHLCITVTVFFLVLVIARERSTAFFASLLFAVHPLNWEAVSNIPGRSVLLCTFFSLNAFFFYVLARHAQGGTRRAYDSLSLLLFIGGLLSKESAAMLPLLIAAHMGIIEGRARNYRRLIPYGVLILLYLLARHTLGITETYPWRTGNEYVLGVLTFLRAGLTFLRLFIWPIDCHFDRAQAMFLHFRDPGVWLTVGAYTGIMALLILYRKHIYPVVWFFIAWFWIELIPVSQLVTTIGVTPGFISAAEHFLYMPSVGMCVVLTAGGKGLFDWMRAKGYGTPRGSRLVVGGFFAFLLIISIQLSYHARTAVTMFARTLHYNPRNARIHYSMGLEMARREEFAAAEEHFRAALAEEPMHVNARLALGRALHDQGKFVEAINVMESVADADNMQKLLETNLEEAYAMAIAHFQERVAREPDNAQAHYSLGTLYSRRRRLEDGITAYKKAVALDPEYKNALFNLASSYQAVGETGWAVVYFERMVALNVEKDHMDRYAYHQLAEMYKAQGEEAKAKRYADLAHLLEGIE